MNDIVDMQVFYRFDSLDEENEGLRLWEFIFGVLIVEEIAPLYIIQNHIEIFLINDSIPQCSNVWM